MAEIPAKLIDEIVAKKRAELEQMSHDELVFQAVFIFKILRTWTSREVVLEELCAYIRETLEEQ